MSLSLECGGTVSNLCQVNREERGKPYAVAAPRFVSTSTCQRPHTTHVKHVLLMWPSTLPLSNTDTHCGQRHHFWRLRSEDSPAGRAEWMRSDGGVQRPPVPKPHLSAAHLHRWGEKYFNCDRSFYSNLCSILRIHTSLTVPNFDCLEFSDYAQQLLSQSGKIWDEWVEAELYRCWSVFLTMSKPVVTKKSSLTQRILESLLLWRPLVL